MSRLRMLVPLAIVAVLAGCGVVSLTGSGNILTQDEAITGFSKLDVSQGFQVTVSQSEDFSVVIRVDDNVAEHVVVDRSGRTLSIGLRPHTSYFLSDVTLEATVTMPDLTGLELSGGSDATISWFSSAKDLTANLSGGSQLHGYIVAGDATFDCSGGSQVALSGSAGNMTIDASGGSHATLADLQVSDVTIQASGGSHVTVNAGGTLNADASGGSQVRYVGSPTMGTIDTSGDSSVQPE